MTIQKRGKNFNSFAFHCILQCHVCLGYKFIFAIPVPHSILRQNINYWYFAPFLGHHKELVIRQFPYYVWLLFLVWVQHRSPQPASRRK